MDYESEVSNICQIFKEVTGAELDPKKEMGVIMPFLRDHRWTPHDFRLVIEYSFSDPKEKAYLLQIGRMNLRTIFHAGRSDFVFDIHADLKRVKEIEKKAKESSGASPDIRTNEIRSPDAVLFSQRFIKIADSTISKGYRWKWDNQEEYERVMNPVSVRAV